MLDDVCGTNFFSYFFYIFTNNFVGPSVALILWIWYVRGTMRPVGTKCKAYNHHHLWLHILQGYIMAWKHTESDNRFSKNMYAYIHRIEFVQEYAFNAYHAFINIENTKLRFHGMIYYPVRLSKLNLKINWTRITCWFNIFILFWCNECMSFKCTQDRSFINTTYWLTYRVTNKKGIYWQMKECTMYHGILRQQ